MPLQRDWKIRFEDHLTNRGKIQQLAELTAIENLIEQGKEQRKNEAAEGAAVRKKLWDSDETSNGGDVGDDEMGNTTILGDYTVNPAPIMQPASAPIQERTKEKSNIVPVLLAAALATMVPAAGVVGYIMSNRSESQQQASPEFDDSSVNLGLGRIEDYLN